MWRWWILAGLVVMALGAVACADPSLQARCFGSSPDEGVNPTFAPQPNREFHRLFSSRLDVVLWETARLTIVVQNTQDYNQVLNTGLVPPANFLVIEPDCRLVWHSPRAQLLPSYQLEFEPHEVKGFSGEWSLIDDWGALISPGDYIVYGSMAADVRSDAETSRHAQLVVSAVVEVDEARIGAARPAHPPTPLDPSACGPEPASEARVHKVMEEHSETLREWDRWAVRVLAADLLDESRMSTGRRGIRVVSWPLENMPGDSPLHSLPECLDGVPVQLVVRPDH